MLVLVLTALRTHEREHRGPWVAPNTAPVVHHNCMADLLGLSPNTGLEQASWACTRDTTRVPKADADHDAVAQHSNAEQRVHRTPYSSARVPTKY